MSQHNCSAPARRLAWGLAAGLCMAWLLLALPAQAQTQSISIDVRAGFAGTYRLNEWFPVQITIANNGPDARGQLEWRFPTDRNGRFQHEIDLPRGARKQVMLYVASTDFYRNGTVVFVENGRELARKDVKDLDPIDVDKALYAVASSDPALLNSLNGLTPAGFSSAVVRHIDLAAIPDQPQGLRGVNVLVLHDLDTAPLSAAQRAALAMWVQLGGQLVVSGGSNGALVAAGVAELLPVAVGDGFGKASLAPLAKGADSSQLPTSTTVNTVTPRAGAAALFGQAGATPLLFQTQRGNGTITFTAFDVAALRGWQGEPNLWNSSVAPSPQPSLSANARQQRSNLLSDVLHLRALNLVPITALLAVLALYVLAIGPLNYLLLRRLKRLEWAWLTIPLVVFGFVAGVYGVGRFMRGSETQLVQVTVVQASQGQDRALATTYNGLFSPTRARYTISLPVDTLVQELQMFDDPSSDSAVVTSDSAVEVRNTLISIGEIRTLLSESVIASDTQVTGQVQTDAQQVRGQIAYSGSAPLEDAVVVRGQAFQSLGTLAPGATSKIDFKADGEGFPWTLNLSEVASIDRQQLLDHLLKQRNTNAQAAEPTYLIGWHHAPASDLQVNGAVVKPTGTVLYIIRLDSQPVTSSALAAPGGA